MANANMNFMSGIHRLKALSLDDSEVFNTLQGLKNYITNLVLEDGSKSQPYNGQVVAVIKGWQDNGVWVPRLFVIIGNSVPYTTYEVFVNSSNIKDVTASLEQLKDASDDNYNPLKIMQDLEVNGWVRSFNIEAAEIFTRVLNVNNWEISQDAVDNSLVFKYVPGKISDNSITLILTDDQGNLLAVDENSTAVNARAQITVDETTE